MLFVCPKCNKKLNIFEGKAVCEGYSKLFQYLCYSVGINATQVVGTSNGNHMWNTACIDGKWYQVDVTWSDGANIISYSYFNLTNGKISKTHLIDDSVVAVPLCNSTENSYVNVFAVYVPNLREPPSNCENAIKNMKLLNEEFIYIYFEGLGVENIANMNSSKYTNYIQQNLMNDSSYFISLLLEKGLYLEPKIYMCNEFYALKVIKN